MKRMWVSIRLFLRDIFNLSHEQASHDDTVQAIEKGVDFKGINVWTLIFAIFVASVGLNVNSTAVIIGAMLISPLMGPIMGLGLSVGIYDFALLKRSLKNLSIAVIISVATSALYFLVSPLSEAQSELLSRTTPTIYDVLIALFGGLAGIVAGATREKGNAIPGVAIATALMPPLCTAGFGIATGNLLYFIGAFYLFFINAVMISFATFLMVRFLKFPLKQEVNKAQSVKVKRSILFIVALTVLPSIYFAVHIVRQTVFNTNALNFVTREFDFANTQVLQSAYRYQQRDSNTITVLLTGKLLDAERIGDIRSRLSGYGLSKTRLVVRQGSESAATDLSQLRNGIIEDLYRKNEMTLKYKDSLIMSLQQEIRSIHATQFPVKDMAIESHAINPKIFALSVNQDISYNVEKEQFDTLIIANIKVSGKLSAQELKTVQDWLRKRTRKEKLKVIPG